MGMKVANVLCAAGWQPVRASAAAGGAVPAGLPQRQRRQPAEQHFSPSTGMRPAGLMLRNSGLRWSPARSICERGSHEESAGSWRKRPGQQRRRRRQRWLPPTPA